MELSEFHYTPYYCEENIWYLCQNKKLDGLLKKVVIISNEQKSCRFWGQRAATSIATSICWDYHVILLSKKGQWEVLDLDSLFGFPLDFEQYMKSTFRNIDFGEAFSPLFRVIDSNEYVTKFSSDRSHMITQSGKWLAPPPPWPPIIRNEQNTFGKFIDFKSKWIGKIMQYEDFYKNFSKLLFNYGQQNI